MTAIIITEAAQEYLADLLSKQEESDVGIRVFIIQPGTPRAETCLAYCQKDDQQPTDKPLVLSKFTAWIDADSESFLEDAVIDFTEDRMGGQLTIKAPNAKVPMISDDSSLNQKIEYYLQTEVNPNLAGHGGHVSLVEIAEGNVAILRFGGGCQGCGMVDTTLKDGVEKTLLACIPELTAVSDVTDHSNRDNAYF